MIISNIIIACATSIKRRPFFFLLLVLLSFVCFFSKHIRFYFVFLFFFFSTLLPAFKIGNPPNIVDSSFAVKWPSSYEKEIMKKNALATVPTDTPKRLILYPHQEPTNPSTINGLNVNKTRANFISNQINESNSNGTTNQRVFRPALQTTSNNGLSKTVEKPSHFEKRFNQNTRHFIFLSEVDDGTPMAPA